MIPISDSGELSLDEYVRLGVTGVSIGSNDLTQLVLGVDRDSEIVAHVFDERNDAVKRMIASVIRTARERGKKIGICGQAPSDYPEFARFLVESFQSFVPVLPVKDVMAADRVVRGEQGREYLLAGLGPDASETEREDELTTAGRQIDFCGECDIAVFRAVILPGHLEIPRQVLPAIGVACITDRMTNPG